MKTKNIELSVKNMVCNRCIKVIREELMRNKIDFVRVDLGKIELDKELSEKQKENLLQILEKEGFELLEDKNQQRINFIKNYVIEQIHQRKKINKNQKLSEVLSENLGMDYTNISKLFSQIEGQTIEHYVIQQKIERVKELLMYGELTLSQISYELDYSSPQHLSGQFKKITGMTPSDFKENGIRKTLDTI
ncbi:MAG: helix-turn-helix domain-containing protein [Flavobacteriales bacterium]